MQFLKTLFVAASVVGLTVASPTTSDPAPFKYEKAGKLATTSTKLQGKNVTISGVKSYISYGKNKKTDVAILYLSDIFGLALPNNLQLVDKLAKAGYFVVAPDLFDGEPVPADALGTPGYNITAWRERHPQARVDAIIDSTIAAMKGNQYKVKKLASVGYCFGGKYVARYLAPGKGLDAGFTAHPSGVVAAEWEAIRKPISIAFGELDASSTPAQRAAAEAIFTAQNTTFQTALYSNAEHGFAVRTNLTDPQKRFAQESAYVQAVRFFDAYVKGL